MHHTIIGIGIPQHTKTEAHGCHTVEKYQPPLEWNSKKPLPSYVIYFGMWYLSENTPAPRYIAFAS